MPLADEYEAAKYVGEVAGHGGARNFKVENADLEPTIADLGLSKQAIHEAWQFRDAKARDPGIIRRAVEERQDNGKESTKSAVRDPLPGRCQYLTNSELVRLPNARPTSR